MAAADTARSKVEQHSNNWSSDHTAAVISAPAWAIVYLADKLTEPKQQGQA